MNYKLDILIALAMILMWLMGFWAHWYRTLIQKQKVTRRLFELAEGHEKEAFAILPEASCKDHMSIGQAGAYVYSAKLISENI